MSNIEANQGVLAATNIKSPLRAARPQREREMGLFIDRKETPDQIILVCKLNALGLYLSLTAGLLILGAMILNLQILFVIGVLLVPLALACSIPYFRAAVAIREAIEEGRGRVSGKKYSFSDPLVYTIDKKK